MRRFFVVQKVVEILPRIILKYLNLWRQKFHPETHFAIEFQLTTTIGIEILMSIGFLHVLLLIHGQYKRDVWILPQFLPELEH